MINQRKLILFIIAFIVVQAGAQNTVPVRSDISYEVSADSLLRNNSPQDLKLSLTCGSADDIDAYVLRLSDGEALWTVVSAELNGQPLWLIMNEGKPERSDVLAWQYDQTEKILRLYPPPGNNNYDLNLVLQVNLLRSNTIKKMSIKEVALETESSGSLSRCSNKGIGNKVAFK